MAGNGCYTMKLNRLSFVFTLMMPFAHAVQAEEGSETANMHVTLEVLKSCSVTAQDMDFGSHPSSETGALSAESSISVTCTNGTDYRVTATSVNGDGDNFTLVSDSSNATVPYSLYADEAKSQQLSSTTAIEDHQGSGKAEEIKLYGKIAESALTEVPAGQYQDDVTLQVIY